jgi:hypothetical protein
MGNIELKIAAGGWVDNNHDRNALQILVRYQARALIGIIRVQLDKVSPLANLSLHYIV